MSEAPNIIADLAAQHAHPARSRRLVWLFLVLSLPVGAMLTVFLVVMLGRIVEDNTKDLLERNGNRMADYVKAQIEDILSELPDSDIQGHADRITRKLKMLTRLVNAESLRVVNMKNVIVASLQSEMLEQHEMCAADIVTSKSPGGSHRHLFTPVNGHESNEPVAVLCVGRPIIVRDMIVGGLVLEKNIEQELASVRQLRRQLIIGSISMIAVLYLLLLGIVFLAEREFRRGEAARRMLERLQSMGNLAAGVAHEIRNPLNSIGLSVQYMQRLVGSAEPPPDDPSQSGVKREVDGTLVEIGNEIQRLEAIIEDFVNFAKPTDVDRQPCDLAGITGSVLELFREHLAQSNVIVANNLPETLPAVADESRIRQVLTNLVKNARESLACEGCPEDGRVLAIDGAQTNGVVQINVTDTGPGFDPEVLPRVFEPYYSTKRGGLGLGLALSRRIARAHGGDLAATNVPNGRGARFTLTIPANAES